MTLLSTPPPFLPFNFRSCEDIEVAIGQAVGTTVVTLRQNSRMNCITQGWILHLVRIIF